jgi:hypothetical protein
MIRNETRKTGNGEENRSVRRGVSKGVKNSHMPPALQGATPEMAMRPFQGWLPPGCRKVGHDMPSRYFRESMAFPCHTPLEEKQDSVKKHNRLQEAVMVIGTLMPQVKTPSGVRLRGIYSQRG